MNAVAGMGLRVPIADGRIATAFSDRHVRQSLSVYHADKPAGCVNAG